MLIILILFPFLCSNDVIKFVLNADGEWVPTLAVQVPNQTNGQDARVPNQTEGNQGAQVPIQTNGQYARVPNQATVRLFRYQTKQQLDCLGTKPNKC